MARAVDLATRVEQLGIEEVGRQYALRTRHQLDELGRDLRWRPPEVDEDSWIDTVAFGHCLDPEVRLQLVLAAANAAPDDEVLWCIADNPADVLVGDSEQMGDRLHEARRSHERVDRMFRVMQEYHARVLKRDPGWWADDWPTRSRS